MLRPSVFMSSSAALLGRAACGMLGVLTIGLVFSTAAWAADDWPYRVEVTVPPMPFSYAVVSANRRSLGVCDMQQDGNGVYGYFWLTNGTELKVRDPNGSAGGCGNMSDLPAPIKKFKVCEDRWVDECSDEKPIGAPPAQAGQ